MYLERNIDHELRSWKEEAGRKPLLIRGARQVGKSSSVRKLGESFELFLEINFEEHKSVNSLFQGDLTPQVLCENLSVMFDTVIVPGKTLLFFDEIQACLPAISSLRFFYEKMPELHVVAAGSLLEFALKDIASFGVGRIRSAYMFPLSFDEFLIGTGQAKLMELKSKAGPQNPLPSVFHEKTGFALLTAFGLSCHWHWIKVACEIPSSINMKIEITIDNRAVHLFISIIFRILD